MKSSSRNQRSKHKIFTLLYLYPFLCLFLLGVESTRLGFPHSNIAFLHNGKRKNPSNPKNRTKASGPCARSVLVLSSDGASVNWSDVKKLHKSKHHNKKAFASENKSEHALKSKSPQVRMQGRMNRETLESDDAGAVSESKAQMLMVDALLNHLNNFWGVLLPNGQTSKDVHISISESSVMKVSSSSSPTTTTNALFEFHQNQMNDEILTNDQPTHIVQPPEANGINKNTQMVLHTYHYPPMNITLYGLSLTLPKFKAWVGYMLQNYNTFNHTNSAAALFDMHSHKEAILNHSTIAANYAASSASNGFTNMDNSDLNQFIVSQNITIDNAQKREQLRQYWFDRMLISDRTEVLASYSSNQLDESKSELIASGKQIEHSRLDKHEVDSDDTSSSTKSSRENKNTSVYSSTITKSRRKRGGFNDLLSVYADRLISILKDEQRDMGDNQDTTSMYSVDDSFLDEMNIIGEKSYSSKRRNDSNKSSKKPPGKSRNFSLTSWLHSEYGIDETDKLMYKNFSAMQRDDQLKALQHFLDWFRDKFPYYYDRCDSCNASFRDDESSGDIIGNDDNEEEKIDGTFLGYMYPSSEEIESGASRVELYHCHKCHAFTRFPRFNSISSIVKYGRGRCGEYSILVYRTLRHLGHHARWVIDWSDHVWVECWLGQANTENDSGRWIHLDPCEAACDQPFLYQDWGKKQTLIMAFWAPKQEDITSDLKYQEFPLIEDVTAKYTTETLDSIQHRREESSDSIRSSIKTIRANLKAKMSSLTVI